RAGAANFLEKRRLTTATLERAIRFALQERRQAEELGRRVEERTAELARANERLREETAERARAEGRLRLALSAARMGAYEYDLQRGRAVYSEELGALFGLPPGEQFPDREAFLAAVHPEDRPRVEEAIRQTIESGGVFNQEYRVVWPTGGVHW